MSSFCGSVGGRLATEIQRAQRRIVFMLKTHTTKDYATVNSRLILDKNSHHQENETADERRWTQIYTNKKHTPPNPKSYILYPNP